jgi:hypothetical protein
MLVVWREYMLLPFSYVVTLPYVSSLALYVGRVQMYRGFDLWSLICMSVFTILLNFVLIRWVKLCWAWCRSGPFYHLVAHARNSEHCKYDRAGHISRYIIVLLIALYCIVCLYIFGQNSESLREGDAPPIDLVWLERVKWMHKKTFWPPWHAWDIKAWCSCEECWYFLITIRIFCKRIELSHSTSLSEYRVSNLYFFSHRKAGGSNLYRIGSMN